MVPREEQLDSICREMFECGYAQLADPVKRRIAYRRLSEIGERHNFVPQEASARCARCGRSVDEHEFRPSAPGDAVYATPAATETAVEAAADELL